MTAATVAVFYAVAILGGVCLVAETVLRIRGWRMSYAEEMHVAWIAEGDRIARRVAEMRSRFEDSGRRCRTCSKRTVKTPGGVRCLNCNEIEEL